MIICCDMTPDCMTPSTACLVQAKLGLNDCHVIAFDLMGHVVDFYIRFQVAVINESI